MDLLAKYLWYPIIEVLLFVLDFVMSRTPLWLNRFCCDAIFFCFYPLIRVIFSYDKTLIRNLTMIYGDSMTGCQISRIAHSCMRNIVRMPGDLLYYGSPIHRRRLFSDISITGTEHIEDALKAGKGVIGLGAHMTHFLLLTVRLAQSELPFIVLIKSDSDNPVINKKFRAWRATRKIVEIDVGVEDKGMSVIAEAFKENRLIYFIADQRRKRNAMVVPFFGRPAYTAVGPAVFSKKTGAPIIPIFVAGRNGGICIDILQAVEDSSTGDYQADIRIITERANLAIERYIRQYPDQWLWTQPRWKP